LSTLLYHLYTVSGLHTTSPSQLLSLVEELDQPSDNLDADWKAWGDSACVSPGSPLHAFTSAGWEYADVAAAARFWQAGTDVAEKLGVTGNDVHLLANGRVSHPSGRIGM
jgi:UDP-glucose:glycoprotein glucosyltransferase